MRDGRLVRFAVAGAVVCLCANLTAAVFRVLDAEYAGAVGALLSLTFPAVGLVILRAHPRNGVGWVFVVTGVLNAINSVGDAVGGHAVRACHVAWKFHQPCGWSESLAHVAEVMTITWFPGLFSIITVALLRFPTGELLSHRWRWVERGAVACMTLWLVPAAVVSSAVPAVQLDNDAAPHVTGWKYVLYVAASSSIVLVVPFVVASALSLIVRWRRSGAVQRAQIRWVAAAGVVAVLAETAVDLLPEAGVHVGNTGQTIVESTAFSLVAIATGVAITRYKLYEIDRIVSRGVSYASVTILLAATYVGIVALGSTVIPKRYGSVGVAVATLVVAALFVPVRRRIQQRVDRRFDRARYDAARIVDRFAVTIRADLDQRALTGELLRTVQSAVTPATASIWLVPRSVDGYG